MMRHTILVGAAASVAAVDPKYAVNLTMFHVNGANYSGIANMDTGDAAGDAFFALRSVYVPMECSDPNHSPFTPDCNNPEVVGEDLTVTEVVVTVDSRFGNYSACNVCVNNTVPFTKNTPCIDGDYVCVCGSFPDMTTHCPPTVGMKDLSGGINFGPKPKKGDPKYTWWLSNLVERVQGIWYSMPAAGECKDDSAPGDCYWKIVETKRRVYQSCQEKHIFSNITAENAQCFSSCPEPTNTTSNCFIDCFFSTILGQDSGLQNVTGQEGQGWSKEKIVSLWSSSVTNGPLHGGCPGV